MSYVIQTQIVLAKTINLFNLISPVVLLWKYCFVEKKWRNKTQLNYAGALSTVYIGDCTANIQ